MQEQVLVFAVDLGQAGQETSDVHTDPCGLALRPGSLQSDSHGLTLPGIEASSRLGMSEDMA